MNLSATQGDEQSSHSKVCKEAPEFPCRAMCLRPMDELILEFQKRNAGKVNGSLIRTTLEHTLLQSEERIMRDDTSDPHLSCLYEKSQMLCILTGLREANKCSPTNYLNYKAIPAHDFQCVEDPNLDDEQCLVQLEAREAREIGADTKNFETFGSSAVEGWSYEQAVAANSKLALGPVFNSEWDTWDGEWSQDTLSPTSGWDTWDGQWSEETSTPTTNRGPSERVIDSAARDWLDYGCWDAGDRLICASVPAEPPSTKSWDAICDTISRAPNPDKWRLGSHPIQAAAWQPAQSMTPVCYVD